MNFAGSASGRGILMVLRGIIAIVMMLTKQKKHVIYKRLVAFI